MTAGNDRRTIAPTLLATIAACCFSYFVAALLLMHLIRPDYTVVDHMISDYAVGRFGWIMTTAFLAAAMGCLALSIGMFREGPATWPGRLGSAALIVVSAGLVVTAIFPTDLETAPSTRTGDIHTLSFLVNVASALLAVIFLGLSYGSSDYWQRRKYPALGFAALLIAAFIAQFLTLHRGAPYGITNRVFVAILMSWFISTSFWLWQVAASRQKTGKG